MAFLQFLERMFWMTLLGALGAFGAPEIADFFGAGWSMDTWQAVMIGGTSALIKEVVSFAQWRVGNLPNPAQTPTPVVSAIIRGSGE